MANVKRTKAFMRAEIEDAYLSIVAQFKDLRDTARVFKSVSKDGSRTQMEQIEHLANGQLNKILFTFKGIEEAVRLLYVECERIYYTVTEERKRALHQAGRPLKYLLHVVIERYKAAPQDGRQTLGAFWMVAASLATFFAKYHIDVSRWKRSNSVIDQIFEAAKSYEEELRKFKVGVMRYITSAQFTGVITRERLGEKWNIGNGEREGEDAVAEAEAQIADGNDPSAAGITTQIEYDEEARTLKSALKKGAYDGKDVVDLAIREAREFINAKKRRRAEDEDDDDDDGAERVAETDGQLVEDLLVPEKVSKRGGKNLRRRTRTQIELLKAQARGVRGGSDDDDESGENSDAANGDGGDTKEVDEPSLSEDSDGAADFKPERSEDSDVESDDANDASQDSSDELKDADDDDNDGEADGDEHEEEEKDADDDGDDDEHAEDDADEDDDDEEQEKPKKQAREVKQNGVKRARTNGTASAASTTTSSAKPKAVRAAEPPPPPVADDDDAEDTRSETKQPTVVQTTATTTTTTTTAPQPDPFADLEF